MTIQLDSDLIKGFSESFLKKRFDGNLPTPPFHSELWGDFCSDQPNVAWAAPRGTAKTTAITHTATLASVLFRQASFVLLVSDTEGQVVRFLGDIKSELENNTQLRQTFGVVNFVKSTEVEIIVQMADGHQFCIVARGAEQKVRGIKWNMKRPDLIVVDDLENDEQVMSPNRREKLRHWFLNSLLPCGSDNRKIRMVGTILHMDSILERVLNDSSWFTRRYEAHNDDFSVLLWPQKLSKEKLLSIRQTYISQGNPSGYYQEYRNRPIDPSSAYFNKSDLIHAERPEYLEMYAAVDFAITKKTKSDFTVIVVAGMDRDGVLHVVDVRRGRWDGLEIIENLFWVHEKYEPGLFIAEQGQIRHTLDSFLNVEMRKRNKYINLVAVTPKVDKEQRAKPLQARLRGGGIRFDVQSEWFADLQDELLSFPRGSHDDMVDALAYIALSLESMPDARSKTEIDDESFEEEYAMGGFEGISSITGY